jgi:hypothetical protein
MKYLNAEKYALAVLLMTTSALQNIWEHMGTLDKGI